MEEKTGTEAHGADANESAPPGAEAEREAEALADRRRRAVAVVALAARRRVLDGVARTASFCSAITTTRWTPTWFGWRERRDAHGERARAAPSVTCLEHHEAKVEEQVTEGWPGCAATSPPTRRGA